MPSINLNPLWIALAVLLFSTGCHAFGAGNIPTIAFLEGKAFRHGDIEDILADLLIRAASSSSTKSATGFAAKAVGKKFSGLNVKRTYFGNWLRDYSQAIDVGTLSKGLDVPTIRILVWLFGFLSFGYATGEFEVTIDRLGVYRPEEHIDNPKDYADNVDARQYEPRLRGPVDPRELQIDPRTGMKNYIANEQGGWTTSTKYIRDSLLRAIDLGRRAATDAERYEALRLLGQSLHTLEDLTAHSNWIELALIELGYNQVFPHVGSNTQIQLNKPVWPMVTGTFGGVDFIHSLLGELTDHISQTSVTDLNSAVTEAEQQNAQDLYSKLSGLVSLVPQGQSQLDGIQQSSQQMGSQSFKLQGTSGPGVAVSAEEIVKQIYPIFALRDTLMKTIVTVIDKIPGLKEIVDDIKNTLTLYVLTIIQPFIKPILRLVTENVTKGSSLVMEDTSQYLVWNDPNSSDPTHSMLSKDHFSCYLNEPAGKVAQVIVQFAVTQVVLAWSNETIDPRMTIDSILQCFCHPALLTSSQLHTDMLTVVKTWIEQLPADKKSRVLLGLTRDGVKQGLHHDDEKVQIEQQPAVQRQPQPALPFIGGSAAMAGAVGVAGSIGSRTVGSTGTFYAQGMVTSSTLSNGTQTTGFRLWPYNMDFYTGKDDNPVNRLSPYFQQLSGYTTQGISYQQTMSTYSQPANAYVSNFNSTVPVTVPGSVIGLSQGSTLPSQSYQSSTNAYSSSIANSPGISPTPTVVPGQTYSSSPTAVFNTTSGSVPVTSTLTQPLSSTSANIFTSTSGVPPLTSTLSSQIPANVYGNAAITSVGPGTPTVTTTGQGTNSSYYGQVTDHGKTSSQPASPVQLTSSLPVTAAQIVGVTPVSQLSAVQSSLQNMNINDGLGSRGGYYRQS